MITIPFHAFAFHLNTPVISANSNGSIWNTAAKVLEWNLEHSTGRIIRLIYQVQWTCSSALGLQQQAKQFEISAYKKDPHQRHHCRACKSIRSHPKRCNVHTSAIKDQLTVNSDGIYNKQKPTSAICLEHYIARHFLSILFIHIYMTRYSQHFLHAYI